jgi:hypothetical protein
MWLCMLVENFTNTTLPFPPLYHHRHRRSSRPLLASFVLFIHQQLLCSTFPPFSLKRASESTLEVSLSRGVLRKILKIVCTMSSQASAFAVAAADDVEYKT